MVAVIHKPVKEYGNGLVKAGYLDPRLMNPTHAGSPLEEENKHHWLNAHNRMLEDKNAYHTRMAEFYQKLGDMAHEDREYEAADLLWEKAEDHKNNLLEMAVDAKIPEFEENKDLPDHHPNKVIGAENPDNFTADQKDYLKSVMGDNIFKDRRQAPELVEKEINGHKYRTVESSTKQIDIPIDDIKGIVNQVMALPKDELRKQADAIRNNSVSNAA